MLGILLVNAHILIIPTLQINWKTNNFFKKMFQKETKMLGDEILHGKNFKDISLETASFPCVFLCKNLFLFL